MSFSPPDPNQPPSQPPAQWSSGPVQPTHWQQPGASPYGQMTAANPFESETTPILVTGILSLVVCGPLGIYAWIKGNGLRDRANSAGWPEPSTAKVGRILGIVGTVIGVLQIAYLIFVLVLVVGLAGTGAT